MKTIKYVLITALLLLLWQLPGARAQNKIQVVTKTIERQLPYKNHTQLRLTGEKAAIRIQGWDKNYIGLTLKLIAKHPDRKVAEQELEHLRYLIEFSDNIHDVGNYFSVQKTTNPIRANLKAEYDLMVPRNCSLILNTKYGEASIIGTNSRAEIKLEYSKLTLQQVQGDMEITSTLGDITGTNLTLDLNCKAEKADIDLTDIAGTYRIENTYGHIKLKAGDNLSKLLVQGNRTDVAVWVNSLERYNYDLSTSHADISLPAGKLPQVSTGAGGKRNFQHSTGKNKPLIKVTTSNSPVTLGLRSR